MSCRFPVFSGGFENASRETTWHDLASMIRKRQQKDGWEFLFLAANQDAIATAAQMNIHAKDAATVDGQNLFSPRQSGRAFGRKVRSLREGASVNEDHGKTMEEIVREEEGGVRQILIRSSSKIRVS